MALIDIPRFEPYLTETVRNARSALPQHDMTVEDMMAADSTMPRAVAEWEIARLAKYRRDQAFGDMSHEFAGVTTQRALFALSPTEAAARWLEAQDERTEMRAAMQRAGCPLSALVAPSIPPAPHTVLGVVQADDNTAFVIQTDNRFGEGASAALIGSERVIVLHRTGGAWRIEPRRDLLREMNVSYGFGGCPKVR